MAVSRSPGRPCWLPTGWIESWWPGLGGLGVLDFGGAVRERLSAGRLLAEDSVRLSLRMRPRLCSMRHRRAGAVQLFTRSRGELVSDGGGSLTTLKNFAGCRMGERGGSAGWRRFTRAHVGNPVWGF